MNRTTITVSGEPGIKNSPLYQEWEWNSCLVDGEQLDVDVVVRRWKTNLDGNGNETLPIEVYLDNESLLYPTEVIIKERAEVFAMEVGLIYRKRMGLD